MAGILVCSSVIYLHHLDRAPVYLGWDEARTAVQGYLLATTGRDMNGQPTPLLFHITDPLIPNHSSNTWWQPTLFYLTAGVLLVAPLAEWSVRLPNVMLALVNIWLIYAVGRRLFRNPWHAVIAALLLALTPVHFFFARLAQDYFLSLTFALLWLHCLVRYLDHTTSGSSLELSVSFLRNRLWLTAAMGLVLGAGLYTHISSWITMPFYLGLTSLVLVVARRDWRPLIALFTGFAMAMLPLLVFVYYTPTLLQDMFNNYGIVTTVNLAERVTIYWEYFNPSYLFFSGGADPMWATRRAGVFLLPMAVLLPCGIWSIIRHDVSIHRLVVLAGFLFAPVPIVVALPEAPHYATARGLLVAPFGALIGAAGAEFLASRSQLLARTAAGLLVFSVPVQFTLFARDYFTDYQRRSAFRHDYLNVRGVVEFVIARDHSAGVPRIYLSDTLGGGKASQWRFHLLTHRRDDLWERTRYFSTSAVDGDLVQPGSLLVLTANDPRAEELVQSGRYAPLHIVKDVTDSPAANILLRK
jgi:hypothetical protein